MTHELESDSLFVVMTGVPTDGFRFYGPFEDGSWASEWAGRELHGEDWWVCELTAPSEI